MQSAGPRGRQPRGRARSGATGRGRGVRWRRCVHARARAGAGGRAALGRDCLARRRHRSPRAGRHAAPTADCTDRRGSSERGAAGARAPAPSVVARSPYRTRRGAPGNASRSGAGGLRFNSRPFAVCSTLGSSPKPSSRPPRQSKKACVQTIRAICTPSSKAMSGRRRARMRSMPPALFRLARSRNSAGSKRPAASSSGR